MSLGVSMTDPLFQALKLTKASGKDTLTTSSISDAAKAKEAPSKDIRDSNFPSSGSLREKTDYLLGKSAYEGHPSSLPAPSKIDDVLRVVATGRDVDARSFSWPSADRASDKIALDGEGKDDQKNHRPSMDVGQPSSWPCSPLVKASTLFNNETTFKEGLGVPINYAEGRNSLTNVLDSIQLCYNPSSKQLHRLQNNEECQSASPLSNSPSSIANDPLSAPDQRTSQPMEDNQLGLTDATNTVNNDCDNAKHLGSENDNGLDASTGVASCFASAMNAAADATTDASPTDAAKIASSSDSSTEYQAASASSTDVASRFYRHTHGGENLCSDDATLVDCDDKLRGLFEESIRTKDDSPTLSPERSDEFEKIMSTTTTTRILTDTETEMDSGVEGAALSTSEQEDEFDIAPNVKIDPSDIISSFVEEGNEDDSRSELSKDVDSTEKELTKHQRQLDARLQQRHQRQQQQLHRGVSDNEASSVSSCFSSASGESMVFTATSEACVQDGENRSDTDSAFQTDESNFSSLRNSLDQAPLSNVATPVLTDSDAPVTPTTLTSTQSAFPFTLDADDATTLKEESGGIGTKKSSDFATPQTVVGGEDPSGCDQGELKSLDVKHECSPDLQSSESDAERSKFVSPSAKKTGITGFLSRGLFSRKKTQPQTRQSDASSSVTLPENKKLETQQQSQQHQQQQQQQHHTGWRLLPRSITSPRIASPLAYNSSSTPAEGADHLDSPTTKTIEEMPSLLSASMRASSSSSSKKVLSSLRGSMIGSTNSLTAIDIVASSTTALILQPRPANLPPKSLEEELKHRQLYEEMVQEAKKRELKDVKTKRKQAAERLKMEDARAEAVKIWLNEILPNWERERHSRRTRDLWWNGLPSAVRGKVWRLAIGNDLNITGQLYEICALRALKLMAVHEAKRRENREVFHSQNGTPRSSHNSTSGVDRAQLAEASSVSSQSSPCHKATSQSSLDGLRSAVPDSSLPNSSSSSSALLPNSPSHSVTSPTLQQDSVTTSHSSSSFQTDHHSDGDPCGDIQPSPSFPSFSLNASEFASDSGELASPFDREGTVDLIWLDVSRTFPHLCIFQEGGPYYDMLHSLLGAYATYRPDVGYVQGMSFLAAFLLLNMDVADAFISFANLLNRPCQLAFFRMDEPLMKIYFSTFEEFLKENMPKLNLHFTEMTFLPEMYLLDWIFSIFCKTLPLDVACRVWDVFLRDSDEFLFRAALGILSLFQEQLLQLDFIQLGQFLSKLPESIDADAFFRAIDGIHMVLTSTTQKTFSQHVSAQKEAVLAKAETSSLYSTASGLSGFGSGGFGNLHGGSMKFSLTGVSLSSTTSLHVQPDERKGIAE